MNKSPLTAFFLSFIPGAGHAYLGRPFRTIVYGGAFFGPLCLSVLLGIMGELEPDIFLFFLLIAALSGIINMVDMIITLLAGKAPLKGAAPPSVPGAYHETYQHAYDGSMPLSYEQQREKTRIVALSIVPGLGHMSLGLMQRGITLLISFIGLFAIIVFLSVIMDTGALLVFLMALPVIWIYSIFDAITLLHAKHRGESIGDRAIFEDLEAHIATGRKNKVLAIALSIFPGAGHLYLGLQKRGLQFMGGFLLAIYIMDSLRLSLFFFLLPLFWCFAFFDGLQQASRYERQELNDEPVLKQFIPYQKWFGIALIGCGVYYLLNRVVASLVVRYFTSEIYQAYMDIIYVIPTVVVAFLFIIFGLRLTFGRMTSDNKQALAPAPMEAAPRSTEASAAAIASQEEGEK